MLFLGAPQLQSLAQMRVRARESWRVAGLGWVAWASWAECQGGMVKGGEGAVGQGEHSRGLPGQFAKPGTCGAHSALAHTLACRHPVVGAH